MSKPIELPEALYRRLEKYATGFHQDPTTVIESIIDEYESVKASIEAEKAEAESPTKYSYNNKVLDKSKLVLNVVTDYVNSQEEDVNLYELSQAFPNELQGSIGVANRFYDVALKFDGENDKHHFVGDLEMLDLQEGKVAVSTAWNGSNIDGFIKRAKELGFSIEKYEANDSASGLSDGPQYSFNSEKLSASHLVLKVITEYVNNQEDDINLYQLTQAFPNSLQGSIGVASTFYDVISTYDGQPNKRHFIGELEMLDLQEGKVAVSTEWGSENIDDFIQHARGLGFEIEVEGVSAILAPIASSASEDSAGDKYSFKGESYGPAHLVLNVVTDYVHSQEEDVNLYQLSQAFPNELQGELGVANKFFDVMTKYDGVPNKQHFVGEYELLDLQEGKVAVSTEWHEGNITAFIEQARSLGYEIGTGDDATVSAESEEAHEAVQEAVQEVEKDAVSNEAAEEVAPSTEDGAYIFNEQSFTASHLVLNVITDYAYNQEEEINLYQLTQAFPDALQGPLGIAKRLDVVEEEYADQEAENSYFIGDYELLDLQDGKVAVASDWNSSNIDDFIEHARKLGYDIEIGQLDTVEA